MGGNVAIEDIWPKVISKICKEPVSDHQRAILSLIHPLGAVGNTVVLAVPSEFHKDSVETKHRGSLSRALAEVMGRDVQIALTVDSEAAPGPDEATTDVVADSTYADKSGPGPDSGHEEVVRLPRTTGRYTGRGESAEHHSDIHRPGSGSPRSRVEESRLNPRYSFDTFVIGASNRFAHAAAVAVAEQPAKAYNPLVIYGQSGLGKTHLLHAVGHYTREMYPDTQIRYISSEEFTNEFINSIRDDKSAEFQRRYRDVDLLLVDDIQFLSGKVQTQEEFFHTFNTLHNNDKQIVLTSDIHPGKLPDFEERLRTRFNWGLITDVQPPDLETRIAILRKKTRHENMNVADKVLEYIAQHISSNIRELEGSLVRVTAFASLNRTVITEQLAQEVLKDLISDQGRPEISAGLIMSECAQYYGFSIDDLCGPSRTRTLVVARQVAMYLCRELTDLSYPKVGQTFGGRDHTTVMHAERKIRKQMADSRSLYNQVDQLTQRINAQARNTRPF